MTTKITTVLAVVALVAGGGAVAYFALARAHEEKVSPKERLIADALTFFGRVLDHRPQPPGRLPG